MTELDAHSRLIAWLKIVLPLLALAILSTLFLVARTIDPEDAIPYAEVDVEERLREPRMTEPAYAGVTKDGAALTLAANEARPDAADDRSGTAKALSGMLETPDGARTDLTAGAARINSTAGLIFLTDGVEITQSNGWKVTTDAMTASMDRTEVSAVTPVAASGPVGELTAQAMHLSEDATMPGRYLLVFKGDVKLIYRPAD